MSHHSSQQPFPNEADRADISDAERRIHEQMGKLLGEYPDGKMNKQDEGALALAVGMENGKIVIRFPKPVAWIGFTDKEAFALAQSLIDLARKISNSPFSLRV